MGASPISQALTSKHVTHPPVNQSGDLSQLTGGSGFRVAPTEASSAAVDLAGYAEEVVAAVLLNSGFVNLWPLQEKRCKIGPPPERVLGSIINK